MTTLPLPDGEVLRSPKSVVVDPRIAKGVASRLTQITHLREQISAIVDTVALMSELPEGTVFESVDTDRHLLNFSTPEGA